MASVNKCIIVGNLGRDPEIRYLPSGDAIANIAVATSYRKKDANTGEQKELTEWHRISFFGRLAELVGEYLRKGSSVYVEGRLQTRKYQKDGVDHYATEIIGEVMQMLGSPRGAGDDGQGGYDAPPARQQQSQQRQQPQGQQRGQMSEREQNLARQHATSQAAQGGRRPVPNFSDMDDDIPFLLDAGWLRTDPVSRQLLRAKHGRGMALMHANEFDC
jgi:single-strand DNA-binding protein